MPLSQGGALEIAWILLGYVPAWFASLGRWAGMSVTQVQNALVVVDPRSLSFMPKTQPTRALFILYIINPECDYADQPHMQVIDPGRL